MSTRFDAERIKTEIRRAANRALREFPEMRREDLVERIAKEASGHLFAFALKRGLPEPSKQPNLDHLQFKVKAPKIRTSDPRKRGTAKSRCRKVAYKKLKQAVAAALDLDARGRGPLEPYLCPRCLKFHLTSQIRKG